MASDDIMVMVDGHPTINVDKGYVPGLVAPDGMVQVHQPRAGVMHRLTPEGISVYMFNSIPGHWYGDHGQEFPVEMAEAAGFDTKRFMTERKKQEAMSVAQKAIEEEYVASETRDVIEVRGDYSLVHLGSDSYNIEFSDGSAINPAPLSRDVAERVFNTMAPQEKKNKAQAV